MYLIIGGAGFLGSYLVKAIHALTSESVVATTRAAALPPDTPRLKWRSCDVADFDSVRALLSGLPKHEAVKIFYLAATHHPDQVEAAPQEAWEVNVTALSRCLNALPSSARLCYASTDCIYGESAAQEQLSEDSLQRPLNTYGRHKCAADALCRFAGHTALRYPFLIGPSLVAGRPHFYDRIASDLQADRPVDMLSDSLRSALTFAQAASLSVRLMELPGPLPPAINVCADQALSKYDIGLMIATTLGVPTQLVRPVTYADSAALFAPTSAQSDRTAVPRARSTVMSNALLRKILEAEAIKLSFTPHTDLSSC